MTGVSPVTSGHDPATAPRIAVAGARPSEAPVNASAIHPLYPSSAVPSVAGKISAAGIPVSVAGHPFAQAGGNSPGGSQAIVTPGCGAGVLTFIAVAALSLIVLTVASYAQTQPLALPTMKVEGKAEPRIGGKTHDPCVAVDIAGHKAGDTDCAAQKLQDAAKAAQDRAKDQPVPNVVTATSPDTKIGVANEAATKQRLGDNFGKSVLPQRPTPPPLEPSPLARH
jgi:hypothetical protein